MKDEVLECGKALTTHGAFEALRSRYGICPSKARRIINNLKKEVRRFIESMPLMLNSQLGKPMMSYQAS